MPTLAEFALRYSIEDMGHLATTTADGRRRALAPDGPLLAVIGEYHLDEVTPAVLQSWWAREISGKDRSVRSGSGYLDALSSVYAYARDIEIVNAAINPVAGFREQLRRRARTKQGRAEAARCKIRPVETSEALDRLVAEAASEGPVSHVLVLLMLDAGLRFGEALGVRWGSITFGADENDRARYLWIRESRPRGGPVEPTKSGRDRRVALSRRLRRALLDLRRARFEPSPDAFVIEGVDPNNFRKREWRRILRRAGIEGHSPKDLRDTFASQLLGRQLLEKCLHRSLR